MKKEIDIIFNSETNNDNKWIQIASGYISETRIHFEKENILAIVHAKGHAEFYNMDGEMLATSAVPPVVSGKEVYEELCCQVEGDKIILQFPIYQWIDNYPHCDGEHDRWDTVKVGVHTLTFDLSTKNVFVA